jgi:hypothetical protein
MNNQPQKVNYQQFRDCCNSCAMFLKQTTSLKKHLNYTKQFERHQNATAHMLHEQKSNNPCVERLMAVYLLNCSASLSFAMSVGLLGYSELSSLLTSKNDRKHWPFILSTFVCVYKLIEGRH